MVCVDGLRQQTAYPCLCPIEVWLCAGTGRGSSGEKFRQGRTWKQLKPRQVREASNNSSNDELKFRFIGFFAGGQVVYALHTTQRNLQDGAIAQKRSATFQPLSSGSDVKNSTLRAFALVPVLVAANHQLSVGGT